MEKFNIGIETERKYIIKMPDLNTLLAQDGYSKSEILQIYLTGAEGETRRVRRRIFDNKIQYTETRKIRINATSSTEMEREITEDEFNSAQSLALQGYTPIEKSRFTFIYNNQLFEIDVYSNWTKTAIMETELDSPDKIVEFPDFIEIIREVTGNKAYSNAGMSRAFPKEDIL